MFLIEYCGFLNCFGIKIKIYVLLIEWMILGIGFCIKIDFYCKIVKNFCFILKINFLDFICINY